MNDNERASGTRGFTVSGFPIELWNQWNEKCITKYGDVRWLKIWNDHEKAKEFDDRTKLYNKIDELETRITKLELIPVEQKEEKKEKITLGGPF